MPTGIYNRTEKGRNNMALAKIGKVGQTKGKHWKVKDTTKYKWTDERKKERSEKTKGKPSHALGKHWKQSDETKLKHQEAAMGYKFTKEQIQHCRDSHIGNHQSEKTKNKQRLSHIKRIELNYGICWPSYNKKACEYFKKFDEDHNTKGHYAMYGGGEHQVKELGYFLDYINFEKKLIIEWDEKHHFDEKGNLKEKDIQRQKEIQEYYPDFEFKRIKG
jgi:hypothetical protein